MRVIDKAPAGSLVGFADCAVGMMPVHQRVIKPHAQALSAGSIHKLANQVASRALLGCAVISQRRIPVAKTLVMLGGHHHVLLSGTFCKPGPLASRVGLGIELLREQLVLRNGNAFNLLGPLMLADNAVQAPMDEHAEFGLV